MCLGQRWVRQAGSGCVGRAQGASALHLRHDGHFVRLGRVLRRRRGALAVSRLVAVVVGGGRGRGAGFARFGGAVVVLLFAVAVPVAVSITVTFLVPVLGLGGGAAFGVVFSSAAAAV